MFSSFNARQEGKRELKEGILAVTGEDAGSTPAGSESECDSETDSELMEEGWGVSADRKTTAKRGLTVSTRIGGKSNCTTK